MKIYKKVTETTHNPENAANTPEIDKTHENLQKVTETTGNPESTTNAPEIVKTRENLKKGH